MHGPLTQTIQILELRQPGRADHVVLVLEDGRELRVPLAAAAGLRAGHSLSPAAMAELEREATGHEARESALRLLSHRARTRSELRLRLLRRDLPEPAVDAVLDDMERLGYLDDEQFARSFVRDRVRARPRGRRRLLAELRRRGVAPGVAERAIDSTFQDEDTEEASLAVAAARAWARRATDEERGALCGSGEPADRERARRRFWGYMSRRGFGPDAIRAGLGRVCDG